MSGHRDTHFLFLQDVQPKDRLAWQTIQGRWLTYGVKDTAVVDSRTARLISHQKEANVLLITCYPFDAIIPGGPLRYVVTASPRFDQSPYTAASAMAGGGLRGRGMIGSVS